MRDDTPDQSGAPRETPSDRELVPVVTYFPAGRKRRLPMRQAQFRASVFRLGHHRGLGRTDHREETMVIRRRTAVVWILAAVAAVAVAATVSGGAGAKSQAKAYPRAATLITSGSQWGNIAGMNPYVGNYAAGMVGLVNETLLRYDPVKGKYVPWLASSAKWTGANCDGFITPGAGLEKLKMLLGKFEEGAVSVGKDPKKMPKLLQLHMSWAKTQDEAERNALEQWPNGGMPFPKGDVRSPEDFAEIAKLVRLENYKNRMIISPDMEQHREQIQQFVDLGFDEIHVHNVGRNQKEFIKAFSKQVIAKLKLGRKK